MSKPAQFFLWNLCFLIAPGVLNCSLAAVNSMQLRNSSFNSQISPQPQMRRVAVEDPLLEEDLLESGLLEEDEKFSNSSPGMDIQGHSQQPQQQQSLSPSSPPQLAPSSPLQQSLQGDFSLEPLEAVQKTQEPPAKQLSKSIPQVEVDSSTEGLPRWDPKDLQKGFIKADDSGEYFYEEESSESNAKEYSSEDQFKPKPSQYSKGLESVARDGSYIYAIEESELEGSASVRLASLPPLPLVNKLGITYEDIYGTEPMILVLIDYDWLAFKKMGQWILSVGTGFGTKNGPGRFIDDLGIAEEVYSIYVVLNHISFTHRFQYTKKPWLVPYISVGVMPTILFERRDDDERNKIAFSPSIQGSGGVRFNIGRLDPYGSGQLDAEYGINNMWLDVEYRRLQSFSEEIDISSHLFNVGLGFDF